MVDLTPPRSTLVMPDCVINRNRRICWPLLLMLIRCKVERQIILLATLSHWDRSGDIKSATSKSHKLRTQLLNASHAFSQKHPFLFISFSLAHMILSKTCRPADCTNWTPIFPWLIFDYGTKELYCYFSVRKNIIFLSEQCFFCFINTSLSAILKTLKI